MKKMKICGITEIKEAEYLNEVQADYAGFIQFFPRSKRNISPQKAKAIIRELDPAILPVAVTVCPTAEHLHIIEQTGFRMIQIHGNISDALLDSISIPVLKAFNVNDLSQYERFRENDKVIGYVFDAQAPGAGKTFDWSLLENIPKDTKPALLAGGLTPENVAAALKSTGLCGADTSSGVENDNGIGKSREKIIAFAKAVRSV
ncbi:MAG: phosphoribosylanthranilate isomerase [Clostridium sp.]|nr:phosphoribosylanthranilate isomerase [Clostridium sp.]